MNSQYGKEAAAKRKKQASGKASKTVRSQSSALDGKLIKQELSRLRDFIKQQEPSTEPDLYELLSRYRVHLEEHIWSALESPITSAKDFEPFLNVIEKAHKQGHFDHKLKKGIVTLKAFLSGESFEDYLPEVVRSSGSSKLRLDWKQGVLNHQEYWKARHLIYEIGDYFNLITEKEAQDIQYDGLKVYNKLRMLEADWSSIQLSLSEAERKTIREMVLFCGCRGNELRQTNLPDEALNLFKWLIEFAVNRVRSANIPCNGTIAYLLYNKAVVFRGQEKLEEAEKTFALTIKRYYERAQARRERKEIDDTLFNIRRVSMCLGFGFGWINLTRGMLSRAEYSILSARSLLTAIDDQLIVAYLNFLLGNIKRCRAGSNPEQLKEAIHYIELAATTFKSLNHERFLSRAYRELSFIYTHLKDFKKAAALLAETEEIAERTNDNKWLTNVYVQRSRLLRAHGRQLLDSSSTAKENGIPQARARKEAQEKFQQAIDWAQRAIDKARNKTEQGEQVLPQIDALMAHGQAGFAFADATNRADELYVKAREDFQEALDKLHGEVVSGRDTISVNAKIESVCYLFMARCFVREHNHAKAVEYLERWNHLEPYVEHGWVRELASKTQEEVKKMYQDLVLNADDPRCLKYDEQVARLRIWIFDQAIRKTDGNIMDAASLIGVSRATLYQWFQKSKVAKRGGRSR